jgi:hypothetical protein
VRQWFDDLLDCSADWMKYEKQYLDLGCCRLEVPYSDSGSAG